MLMPKKGNVKLSMGVMFAWDIRSQI